MAHLKGRALCINVLATLAAQNGKAGPTVRTSFPHDTAQHCSSVSTRAVARHPPAPGHTRVGGLCGSPNNLPGPHFLFDRQTFVATALRCARFQAAAN